MRPQELRCIRCGTGYPVGELFTGCPRCADEGKPSNLEVRYDPDELAAAARRAHAAAKAGAGPESMWRYLDLLPVSARNAVSLGEGATPLLAVPRLGAALGVPNLYVKDESRNPTGSFKDRLAAGAVSAARELGKKVVVGSSSGNAGAAVAALAARAGLGCVMFTTAQFPLAMKTQMAVYGTRLIAAPSIKDRWSLMEAGVTRFGWFPVTVFRFPYFGSNFYGIEGYKTMGYEIADQAEKLPDHIIYPVGAGDAFSGGYKALAEYHAAGIIDTVPKMHAGEIYGPLEHSLAENLDYVEDMPAPEPSVAISVASTLSTYQALNVLRRTGGSARSANNAELLTAQHDLARLEGIFVETSSALSVAVLPKLVADGAIDPDATVVAVLTSDGLKDPQTTADQLPEIPSCGTELGSVVEILREVYQHVDEPI
ncbi:MAG: pyridoxal-phosphate dependent enzyme [Actinomycetia bacterium]|nr:pyridoxal-phosphate dependent enzyme [Actinomycetes bacterium]